VIEHIKSRKRMNTCFFFKIIRKLDCVENVIEHIKSRKRMNTCFFVRIGKYCGKEKMFSHLTLEIVQGRSFI